MTKMKIKSYFLKKIHYKLKNKILYFILQTCRFPSIRNIKGLNIGMTSIPKDQYGYWPIFRQEDTPRSRVTKKKLYSHLLVRMLII